MIQIPSDIVLAFILLVIFSFTMNLFLFYKWHKTIKDYRDEMKEIEEWTRTLP